MSLAIETSGLCKSFNGFYAVDNLNLKVPEGSIYGFLGPNGAGKTTTLKMLTGLTRPTSGSIKILGNDLIFGNSKGLSNIGFLPDVPNYYNWMTAEQFLTFSGELFSIGKRQLNSRICEIMDLVGLGNVKKKISGYSRGMKQRLGIAQALINQPKIVFMDEPVSALDPIGRKEVIDILMKLSGKITIFFSSHILSDVERICDRVLIMDKGKMLLEDSMDNLRAEYSSGIINVDTGTFESNAVLLAELGKYEWVEKLQSMDSGEIKIHTINIGKAQRDIPGIISAHGMTLKKFIMQEPTLEDIFVKVVDSK